MPNIKIIQDQKKPKIPASSNLSKTVPRFKPAGGKPPLPLTKSYNRQGDK